MLQGDYRPVTSKPGPGRSPKFAIHDGSPTAQAQQVCAEYFASVLATIAHLCKSQPTAHTLIVAMAIDLMQQHMCSDKGKPYSQNNGLDHPAYYRLATCTVDNKGAVGGSTSNILPYKL